MLVDPAQPTATDASPEASVSRLGFPATSDLRALARVVVVVLVVTAVLCAIGRYGRGDLIRWDAGGLTLRPPPGFRGVPGTRFPLRALHPVVVAWCAVGIVCAPRSAVPWVAGAAALILRSALSPDTILMGVDYAYIRLSDATGLQYTGKLYGPTWTTFMGLVWYASGGWPDHVGPTNVVLSSATVVFATAATRHLGGQGAQKWAGAVLTCAPLAVALARTETEFVLVGLLQATTVWGALSDRPAGAWLVALSGVLLAHARPDQMPVPVALGIWLCVNRRPVPGLFLLFGVGLRIVGIATSFAASSLASPAGLRSTGVWFRPESWVGAGGTLSELDPTVTPIMLAPLVGVGVLRGRRDGTVPLLALLALTTFPYVHFERPTDVLRFGLPGQTWWAVLAAIGLSSLRARSAVLAAALVLASGKWSSRPLGESFAWQVEHEVVVEALSTDDAPKTVFYRAPWDRRGAFRAWLDLRGATSWKLLEDGASPASGEGYLSGRADARAGEVVPAPPHCDEEIVGRTADIRTDDVEPATESPLRVALLRCSVK